MASRAKKAASHAHDAPHQHHGSRQKNLHRPSPVEQPVELRGRQAHLRKATPPPISKRSEATPSSSNINRGVISNRHSSRSWQKFGTDASLASGSSTIRTQLLAFLAAHSPTQPAAHTAHHTCEEAVAALQQLVHLWSLYKNAAAQASAAGQQLAASQSTRQTLHTDGSLDDVGELHQHVQQVGRVLCQQVLASTAGATQTSLTACQLLVAAVHAMGTLGVYDAALLQAVEVHTIQCSQAGQHLELRQGAQLMAAYAKLGHKPSPVCLHSIITMMTLALDAAAQAAAPAAAPTGGHSTAAQPQQPQQILGTGIRGHHAAAGKHQEHTSNTGQQANRVQGRNPNRKQVQHQAAAVVGSSKGKGTEAVRLQAGARAVVNLAEAMAQLLPGCLRPADVFMTAVGAEPHSGVSQQQLATAATVVQAGTVTGRAAATGTSIGRLPSPSHSTCPGMQQPAVAATSGTMNAVVLLLPAGLPLGAPAGLTPLTRGKIARHTTPADPLMTLLPSNSTNGSLQMPLVSPNSGFTSDASRGPDEQPSSTEEPGKSLGAQQQQEMQVQHQTAMRQSHMLAAVAAWNRSFQAAATLHTPALNLSGLCTLIHSCYVLGMMPTPAWWTAATSALTDAMVRGAVIEEPSKLDVVVPALEALAWMHLSTMREQQQQQQQQAPRVSSRLAWLRTLWLAGAPQPELPLAFKQALQALLSSKRVLGYGHKHLAPLLWASVVLLGKDGCQMADAAPLPGPRALAGLQGAASAARGQQTRASAVHVKQGKSVKVTTVQAQQDAAQAGLASGAAATHIPSTWEQTVLQQLQGHLPRMSPQHTAHALHLAALLGVRPHSAWMYLFQHQVQKHAASYTDAAFLQLVWSLAVLHGPHLQPDPPTTTTLVRGLSRALPFMHHADVVMVQQCLQRMYRRLSSRPLRDLMQRLGERTEFASTGPL